MISSSMKQWRERVGSVDYDTQIKEVRCQLVDQLKVLDLQLEQKSQQLQDLTDYLRRRGEIENDYARSLEKLAERFTSRIKRKEPSSNTVTCVWTALLSQTRQESRDHSGLSESCSSFLIQPLTHCLEYTQRLAKKSKDICVQLQDGLLKVTTEMQMAWRTYCQYHSDFVCAEGKLKEAEKQEEKQKQGATKKLERLIEKRQIKVQDIFFKLSKARNDYLLNLAAVSASMNKYYVQDISSLMDCADAGYHLSLSQVIQAYLTSRWQSQQNLSMGLQQLQKTLSKIDQSQDRDSLMQDHHNTFCMPFNFTYQPHDGDQVAEVSAECEMRCELETRFKQIQARLETVNQEAEEGSKNMSSAHALLLDSICDDDLDASSDQEGSTENLTARPSVAQRRASLQELETLYIVRVKEYLVNGSLACKLQAKHDLLKVAVDKADASKGQLRRYEKSTAFRKIPTSANLTHNHKLFSGDMLSFIEASGQQIPIVVQSCICFINLNGLHHEGIFRVPGSQMEINNLRDAFERGEDPLAEQSYELDSVAGVLKLYFRCLENPLFPIESACRLLEHAQIKNKAEREAHLKLVISSYPKPVIIVMRYLFAFLHHVSQYSDENMMQPYNLAVCFGPSLIRGSKDDDNAVSLQAQINDLVKSFILHHESIFPSQSELRGPVYEKCMTLEHGDCEPVTEGDAETQRNHCQDESETGSSSVVSAISSTSPTQKRTFSVVKRGESFDKSRLGAGPAGGSIASGGKVVLHIPFGPQRKPRRVLSPGNARRESQDQSSAEDISVQVDKEVCVHMDSVFKELISRQMGKEPSFMASSHSAKASQRKGRWDGNRWGGSPPL
ncbi:rho GTPase-activating protein 4-like [Brachionichthys hirsutus]|uniref:rho GTPase-activating protein 4-like n=1 Tax=Brachionichthys hirsutus TaxID=412623 RepID=UPI0036051929